MSAEELRDLSRRASDLAARREEEERQRRLKKEEEERRRRKWPREGAESRWLLHQRRSCGQCRRCKQGKKPHGPYWYVKRYVYGKGGSRYVGRRLPQELAREFGLATHAGETPEEVYPREYHAELAEAVRVVFGNEKPTDRPADMLADAPLGRVLARKEFSRWSAAQRRAAWEMLGERRESLREAGVEFGDLLEPAEGDSATSAGRVTVSEGKHFLVRFVEYVEYLVEEVKEIPGRRYDGYSRTWTVPSWESALDPLAQLVYYAELDFGPEVARLLREAGRRYKRERWRRARNRELSGATDVPDGTDGRLPEIPGLSGTLMPYQRAGLAYALENGRIFLADEMGLGKTLQALATLEAADAFPALVVCPAIVKAHWEREAGKWLPGRSVEVVSGRSAALRPADITVINYDVLDAHKDALRGRNCRAIVLDESHYAKNGRAKRTQACRELAQGAPVRLLLSGTPLVNRPIELVSQLEILGRLEEDFGGFWPFVRRYCGDVDGRHGPDFRGASNLKHLNEQLRERCYVRRTKEEVLGELPPLRRAVEPVRINNRGEYRRARRDVVRWLGEQAQEDWELLDAACDYYEDEHGHQPEGEELERVRAGIRTSKEAAARQAEQLVRLGALRLLAARGKLRAVQEWIRNFLASSEDEKLVVYAHHQELVENIAGTLGAEWIHGATPAQQRQRVIDRFQSDPEARLLVAGIRAAGIGIELTAASNVMFAELDWTPAALGQAEARLHRMGQEKPVTAWYLLAEDTIEEWVYELVEKKRRVVDQVTEGAESRGVGAAEDTLSIEDGLLKRFMQEEKGKDE